MFRTVLEIARLRVALTVHGPFDVDRFRHRFGAYEAVVTQGERLDARVTLWIDRTSQLPGPEAPSYPAMKQFASTDGVKLVREGLSIWLGTDLTAEAFARGREKPLPLPLAEDAGPADTPLRVVVTHALLRSQRGALLHASGYADAGGGVLFAGASGAGKTTAARGLPTDGTLSDDQVAVLIDERSLPPIRVASTPFVGTYGRAPPPREAPLRAVVLLDPRRRGSLERVAAAAAIPSVLACAPLYARTTEDARSALAIAERVARSVPVLRGAPAPPGRTDDMATFYARVGDCLRATPN